MKKYECKQTIKGVRWLNIDLDGLFKGGGVDAVHITGSNSNISLMIHNTVK